MAMTTDTTATSTPQSESAQSGADPHLAWKRRADELRARINAGTLDEASKDALGEELDHLHDQIAATRPTTHAGAIAQLEVALHYLGDPDGWLPAEECQGRALQHVIEWLRQEAAVDAECRAGLEELSARFKRMQAYALEIDKIMQHIGR